MTLRCMRAGGPVGCLVLVCWAMRASIAAGQIAPPILDAASGQPVMYPSYLTEYNGLLYFRGSLLADGPQTSLWATDGNDAHLAAQIAGQDPTDLAVFSGKLYFGTSSALWQYDTASGASKAPGAVAGTNNPQGLTAYNGNLYFRAFNSASGVELYKFNGTNQTLIDIFPGSKHSYPQHFIEFGGLLYFNACGMSGQGTELWRTNGTAVAEAARIYPDNGSSPEHFAVYNNELYFSAYDGVHGRELWKYGGGAASMAADIVPGGAYSSSNPTNLIAFRDKLYFSAYDALHGLELWQYDGAAARMVAEINPTPDPGDGDTFLMDSLPNNFAVYRDMLYFAADDGTHGRELWSFDGTNVSMVMDINPGQYGSDVSDLTVFNDTLYFCADSMLIPGVRDARPQVYSLVVPEPSGVGLMLLSAVMLMRRGRR